MALTPDTPGDDPLFDEALDWVLGLKAGAPTRADLDALSRWRQQSDAHEKAFKAAVRLYRLVGTAARELADEQAASVAPPVPRPPRLIARRAALAGAIATAAGAAGYVMVRPPLGLWPSIEEWSADYRTGKGERRKVAVAPEVSLDLNTQTSIAVRSVPEETRIELISGEAAAKAASSKPFVMLAGNGSITAYHADFDARCLDRTVTVTCLDGTVTVEKGGEAIRLQRTEQVTYSGDGLQPSVVVDLAQVSAWQAGLLIFRDRPLGSVVEEINRYRWGIVIITGDSLKRRLVNGTLQLDKLDDFIGQVERLFGARITHLPGGVVLMS
jgi:transmembrane sensor